MFRNEVIPAQSKLMYGDVSIAIPLPWQVIGFLIGGSAAVSALFLAFASYARVETVAGVIVPAAGISSILPLRSGVITALPVHEGQEVAAGAVLAAIRAEEDNAGGVPAAERIEAAIARQDASLSVQSAAVDAAAQAQLNQLAAQRAGAAAEILQLQSQMTIQHDLVTSAQRDLDRASSLADRGFVSVHDLDQRKETLLARQQGLSQLTQALAAKRASSAEAERNAAQVISQAHAQEAGFSAARAEVAQQAASTDSTRAYVLRAPIAGRVTALMARIGQPASSQVPLMTILPRNSELRAELTVPTSAIGFVKPGQKVRLAIDAFPYQRFGTVSGKILTVAASPVAETGPNGVISTGYPVVVALDQKAVSAYGRQESLMSGMALTARIVTEQQSLLAWLFDPLLAVRRR